MSIKVNIRYYDTDNNTGPNLGRWSLGGIKDKPTATVSLDLDPSGDVLREPEFWNL
jgi:hypothetical protein